MLTLDGNQATITEHASGLAETFSGNPYPHVQHIHIGAMGTCPTMEADANADGVISTTEGAAAYGAIGATLSTSGPTTPAAGTVLNIAPSGSTIDYSRTFTLDAPTRRVDPGEHRRDRGARSRPGNAQRQGAGREE